MKAEKKSNEVIIEVTEEQYQEMRAEGIDEDALLKPGKHKFVRGLFKKMHPDYSPQTSKVRISIYIDADVLAYFRQRAGQKNAAPYQTQINNELRAVMEREIASKPSARRAVKSSQATADYSALLNDSDFIAAIAERVRQQSPSRKRARKAA